jgi:hypothetical protein
MIITKEPEKRINNRVSLPVQAAVKVKTNEEDIWKENVDLISLSRTGAGFYMTRACQVGQLVSLLLSMPTKLRCYDKDKEFYRIWGLVQHCSYYSGEDGETYHVGVAFIGKNVPFSFNQNPLQSYRVSGMNKDGLWKIIEAANSFIIRREPRYWVSLNASLSALDAGENLITDEKALIENISQSGASLQSDLKVEVGDSVKFNCPAHKFSALAVVRHRQVKDSRFSHLHLEFVDDRFPVLELGFPIEESRPD